MNSLNFKGFFLAWIPGKTEDDAVVDKHFFYHSAIVLKSNLASEPVDLQPKEYLSLELCLFLSLFYRFYHF